ncbi:MAG: hypothetical protein KDJ52_10035 [Anaerolineae bacterium]|nr:hypothetical protein [Anaerolineae bacterium]
MSEENKLNQSEKKQSKKENTDKSSSSITEISDSFAALFLEKGVENSRKIEIPSLKITLENGSLKTKKKGTSTEKKSKE